MATKKLLDDDVSVDESDGFGPFSILDVQDAFNSFDLDVNDYVGAAEIRQVRKKNMHERECTQHM
jgi:hypothetical protein